MAVAKHETRRGTPMQQTARGCRPPAAVGRVPGKICRLPSLPACCSWGMLAMAALRAWPGASQPSPIRDPASLSLGSGPVAGEAAERPPTGTDPRRPIGTWRGSDPRAASLAASSGGGSASRRGGACSACGRSRGAAEDCAPVFPVRFRAGVGVPRSAIGASLNRLATWLQAPPRPSF